MPSGPAVSNASNLLYSPRLAEVIRAARGEFDYVLIDTPPMLQLADARIISQHCDTVILVSPGWKDHSRCGPRGPPEIPAGRHSGSGRDSQ